MAQQTLVEWFHIEFQKRFPKETTEMYNNNQLGYEDLIQQAKEMEKQQKEDEYKRGWEDATSTGVKESYKYQDRTDRF